MALLVGLGAAWAWVVGTATGGTPPPSFTDDILVQEIMNVQGDETVVTVYRDGRLIYEPSMLMATSTEPQHYELSPDEVAAIEQAITAAGTDIRRFAREPAVLYEGTYRLRTNLQEYREHTALDAALEKIPAVWASYLP